MKKSLIRPGDRPMHVKRLSKGWKSVAECCMHVDSSQPRVCQQLVQNYRNVKTKDDKMKFKEQYQYTSPSNFLQQNLDKLGGISLGRARRYMYVYHVHHCQQQLSSEQQTAAAALTFIAASKLGQRLLQQAKDDVEVKSMLEKALRPITLSTTAGAAPLPDDIVMNAAHKDDGLLQPTAANCGTSHSCQTHPSGTSSDASKQEGHQGSQQVEAAAGHEGGAATGDGTTHGTLQGLQNGTCSQPTDVHASGGHVPAPAAASPGPSTAATPNLVAPAAAQGQQRPPSTHGLPSASASVPLLTPQHLLLQPQHVNGSRGEDGSLKLVKSSCVMFTPCTRKTVRSCKPKVIRKLQKRISKLLSDPPCVEGEPLGPIFQVGEVLGTGGQGCVASVRPVVLSVSSRGELEVASSGREDMVLKVYHGNRGLQEQELREAALSMLPLSKRVMKASQVGVAWLNTGDAQLKLQPVLSLLMPRAEGGTLADAMDKWREPECAMSIWRILLQYYHILLALVDLNHNNVVHRDLKPQNIAFDNFQPKLLDLGLARFSRDLAADTQPHSIAMGSLSRIAPELNEDRYKAWLNEARSRLEADLKQMAGGSSSSSGSVGGLAFCQDRIKDVDAGLKFYADRRPYVHLADSYTAPMLLLQMLDNGEQPFLMLVAADLQNCMGYHLIVQHMLWNIVLLGEERLLLDTYFAEPGAEGGLGSFQQRLQQHPELREPLLDMAAAGLAPPWRRATTWQLSKMELFAPLGKYIVGAIKEAATEQEQQVYIMLLQDWALRFPQQAEQLCCDPTAAEALATLPDLTAQQVPVGKPEAEQVAAAMQVVRKRALHVTAAVRQARLDADDIQQAVAAAFAEEIS